MKTRMIFGCLVLTLLVVSASAFAQDENSAITNFSLWVGTHYTYFDDYNKLVGEYNRGEKEAFPEFRFNINARKKDGYFKLNGHFFDVDNIFADVSAKKSDRVSISAKYLSLIHQDGLDMLANLEAREWLGTRPGGKMVTHEVGDLTSDYGTNRQLIETDVKVKISEKYRVNFIANHRSILEKGTDQKIATSHCFSCHIESKAWRVDEETHQVRAGVEAEVKDFDVSYFFGYREFETKVGDPEVLFDPAIHPVHGGAGAEFSKRVIYAGEVVDFGVLPQTEKTSHTGRISGKLGKGRLSGSMGFSQAENKRVEIKSEALTGNLAYAIPVSKRVRLVAKVNAMRLKADDVIIDLPYWRAGRPDNNPVNFDFKRYSAIDRNEGKGTLEVLTRLNSKTALSVLGGYKTSERRDYPTPNTAYTTDKYIGQAKVRYNHGLDFNGSLKYRYEKTEDPLRSERGLLEARGREVLQPTAPNFAFYYQREDLRFLNVTSLPTDYHEVNLRGNVRPRSGVNIGVGVKTTYDKNADLDTLDVNHFGLQPNINITVNPNDNVTLTAGYTFNHLTSRGPITIPLFDG